MKRIIAFILAIIMLFALSACGGSAGETADNANSGSDTYTLKMAIYDADIPVLKANYKDFAELISEATGGRVTIEYITLTSLGNATDVLAMVREGTVDMYFNSAAQTGSEFPILDIAQLPYMCDNPTEVVDLLNALYYTGYLDDEFAGLKLLINSTSDMQMMFFSKQVSSLDDIAKLKIRATSGTSATIVERLGATVVTMGLGDVYLALDTGVVDGGMSSPFMINANAFYDNAPYLLNQYLFGGTLFLLMNNAKWESLPADIRLQIKEACDAQQDRMKWNQTDAQTNNIETLLSSGMSWVELDEASTAKFQEICISTWQDWVDKANERGYNGTEILEFAQHIIGNYNFNK